MFKIVRHIAPFLAFKSHIFEQTVQNFPNNLFVIEIIPSSGKK